MAHFEKKKEGDCGENAVKSILSIYGLKSQIKIADKEGTSPQKITNALRERGIDAEVKDKITFKNLRPRSIVYYPNDDHYVAIERKENNKVFVNDSSKATGSWESQENFEKK